MKRRLLLALLLLPSLALAAGSSVTWTKEVIFTGGKATNYHSAAVVSDDAAGTASGAVYLHGYLVQITTDPGATAPTAAWDCTLLGPLGGDVLGGALADRSATATEIAYPLDPAGSTIFPRVDGSFTLTCAAMGNSKTATVVLTVQE